MEQPLSNRGSPDSEESLKCSKPVRSSSSYSTSSSESVTDDSRGKCEEDLSPTITDDYSRNYESDSFESITNEPSPHYESDSFECITGELSRNYGSDSFVSYSKSDLYLASLPVSKAKECKRNDQGKGLIEKWVKILVDGKLHGALSPKPRFETVVHETVESNVMQAYCSIKIQQLLQPSKTQRQKKRQPGTYHRSSSSVHPSCHVPHMVMNRLQLQNIKETMKQAMLIEMHEPATCPDCCNKLAELAHCQFVRMRKTKLENDLLQEKMEEFTYSKNLVTYIGDIHHSLPKPSDECRTIWQRLYNSTKKT